MPAEEIQTRFNALVALDDSLLQAVELKTELAECRLVFDFARLLKAEGGSVFDPRQSIDPPALLSLESVRSLSKEWPIN